MPERPEVDIWTLSDLRTPWCVHVAATLYIADHIAAGKTDLADLAAAAGCDAYALGRMLTHLVNVGLFEEPEPGRFALNKAAEILLNPMVRLSLDLDRIGGRFAHAWTTLIAYVKTGQAGYPEAFGVTFWEDLQVHPQIAEDFDALIGPAGHGMPNPAFEITGGWDAVDTVMDVGGGTGAMLAELLRTRPALHGTLLDLPRTVARSGPIFAAAGVIGRVTTVGQSFFDPLPPGSDLYLLRGILNDFPDAEATTLLRRCCEAARPNGRVVVLKSVTADDTPRPLTIEMVLLGGKHRTITEFRALAAQAGLAVMAAGEQPSGYYVVECRPV